MAAAAEAAADDAEASWKTQLKQLVASADLPALREAHSRGQNLAIVLDDSGISALSLATSMAHDEMVDFLLEALGPALGQEEVLSECIAALNGLSFSRNPRYLDVLSRLMTSLISTVNGMSFQQVLSACISALHSLFHSRDPHFLDLLTRLMTGHHRLIPYVVVLQAAFKILRAPKDLLVLFCETALKVAPELCRDVSLNLVLYEETEVYWQLLTRGMSLNDLWPVNYGGYNNTNSNSSGYNNSQSSTSTTSHHNLFDIYFTYGCLATLHTGARNKITKMTIQAANGQASPAVLYVVQNFPTDLYDDVFKYLMLAGFTMSPAAIHRMATVEIDKAAQLIRWYKDFHCRPHSLKHLCRLCVRANLRTNVVHAVEQILLPEDLKRYLLITDPNSY